METNPLTLFLAGLRSHGFRELEGRAGWRRFGARPGHADRWLSPDDLSIWLGPAPEAGAETLFVPAHPDAKHPAEWSSYHRLLMKCGEVMLRTQAKYPATPAARQAKLALDGDGLLDQLT